MVIKMYNRIKKLRTETGRTQTNVSTLLGIEQSYYSKIELGKQEVSLSNMIKIAELYNVSIDYIVERTNKKEINK